jgi:hypothetical protein
MPRVADYSIIRDSWIVEFHQTTIEFEVPSNIDAGSRCVLGFMMKADHPEAMILSIRINGHVVWEWQTSDGTDLPIRYFQEVVAAGVIEPGKNIFHFDSESSDFTFVQLSDIVVWWQANI